MAQCKFRSQEHACKITNEDHINAAFCGRCLQGQIADEISLNTSTMMIANMDKMEDTNHEG